MEENFNLDEKSDEMLMQIYQQGDESAFEVLYKRHSGRVYAYLQSKLKDRRVTDDLFQASFLKLHQSRSNYDPTLPFIPWLFTVCRSAMIDGLRERKRIQEDLDPVAIERAAAEMPAPETAFSSLPDLNSLPAHQREAIELRYRDDLSFEEIAKRLETSPSNVRQLISRAVRKIKKLVNTKGETSND